MHVRNVETGLPGGGGSQSLLEIIEHKITHLPSPTGDVERTRQMAFFDFVIAARTSNCKNSLFKNITHWST
jgi:hypothetical protein